MFDDQAASNRRLAGLLLGGCGLAVLLVVWAVLAALGLPLVGLVVGVLAGAGAAAFAWSTGESVVVRRTGARPADEETHARLHNLVEGLAVAVGVPKPAVYVVDHAAPNAFAAGRDPRHGLVGVTTGLLAKLDRVELEGVLAHELAHIRNRDTTVTTLATVLPVRGLVPTERESLADASGVGVTRYPPGLAAALEKLRDDPTTVDPASGATAHLWIASPAHPPLEERIEALREL